MEENKKDFNNQFLGEIANKRSAKMGKDILDAHNSQKNQQDKR
jgi:hypothetical protein